MRKIVLKTMNQVDSKTDDKEKHLKMAIKLKYYLFHLKYTSIQ